MLTFIPHIKAKPYFKQRVKVPSDLEDSNEKAVGTLKGAYVEIDSTAASKLNLKYCCSFGHEIPLHECPLESTEECGEDCKVVKRITVLRLEEAFHLSYFLNDITIYNSENKTLQWLDFVYASQAINPNFVDHFVAYLHLKSKGWTVKSGLKFGGHFLAYKLGPQYHHASFVVLISSPVASKISRDVKAIQRVAEAADKDVLFLEVTKSSSFTFTSPSDLQFVRISETIVRRFNLTSFAQGQTFIKH